MRAAASALVSVLVAGCYTLRPVPATPSPETKVSIVLSDHGRVEAAQQVGSETERLEARVLSADDTAYLLAVSSVKPIRGSWVRWNGEQVSMRRDYVAQLSERRLNKGRTLLVVGGGALALFALMVRFDILGFGGLDIPFISGGGGDPGDQ